MITETPTEIEVYQAGVSVVIDGRRYKPCPICGRVEQKYSTGIIRIEHDLERHNIIRPTNYRAESTTGIEAPASDQ